MKIPALVLGGTGYVAGELLRLLSMHPNFNLVGVLSDGSPGTRIGQAFGHLAAVYPDTEFMSLEATTAALTSNTDVALFCAAPHGAAAALIDQLLAAAEKAGTRVRVVDISADYRFRDAAAYQKVYGHAHGAPQRLAQFTCALPEHLATLTTPHVAHPGCFSTATLLAVVPLLAMGLVQPEIFVSAVTGSTGSGRKPTEGTHHPLRHSDMHAYNALAHRHGPEIRACALAASGVDAHIAFVPHSGPFARGIHATVQATLRKSMDSAQVIAALREFYRAAPSGSPFVQILDRSPRIKEVAASNYAQLSAASNGHTVAVLSAIDNLNKGAAGGAVQWMNRLFGLPETTGLRAAAAGWT